ncbi:MAG: hypothetical protein ACKN9D_10410, partial [Actinomycetales bacterium]
FKSSCIRLFRSICIICIVQNYSSSLPGGGDETTFTGAVRIIGGDGAFKGARGNGTMTGFRDGPLGSPVQMTFNLRVVR